jgi:ABC-type amino acid transport substrate-binding protein
MVGLATWAMRGRAASSSADEVDVARRFAEDMGAGGRVRADRLGRSSPAFAGKFDFIIGGMTITLARNPRSTHPPYSATGVDVAASEFAAGFRR